MHQAIQGATFHIEHIQPITCGGSSIESNLALACPSCNLHKADGSHLDDPLRGELVPIYHQRQMRWTDHFEWLGNEIKGRTAVGRATVQGLDLNNERRLRVRKAESGLGLFPP
jgi:hypothetical protein